MDESEADIVEFPATFNPLSDEAREDLRTLVTYFVRLQSPEHRHLVKTTAMRLLTLEVVERGGNPLAVELAERIVEERLDKVGALEDRTRSGSKDTPAG